MGDLSGTSLLYSARPALKVDGTDSPALAMGLLSLIVEESTAGLSSCEATFGNWGAHQGTVDFLYFDRQVLDFGKSLRVEIGAGAKAGLIFDGKITALEGRFPQQRPPEILVLAEDRLQDLRMTRRTRSFEDVKLDDVISSIASDHGLQSQADIDSPDYRILAQINQSDLAFLRERAQAIDAEVWIEGNTIHAQARAQRNSSDVTLTYGQGLYEFAVNADLAGQRTALTVTGWDVDAKEGIAEEASEAAVQNELEGSGGASLLSSAFGERKEQIVHLAPLTTAEATALAEANYRRLARRFVTGSGLAEGNANIRAGTSLTLQGLGPLFDGKYYVVEARHAFELAAGYKTHFQVERAWLGEV